jgi:hypothetical protein
LRGFETVPHLRRDHVLGLVVCVVTVKVPIGGVWETYWELVGVDLHV